MVVLTDVNIATNPYLTLKLSTNPISEENNLTRLRYGHQSATAADLDSTKKKAN